MIGLRHWFAASSLALLASCAGPGTASAPTTSPTLTALPGTQAPVIRFALIGPVTDVNVWALFDARGYSYNNYAVRNEYWPRLYRLSIPERRFEPMAADGMPSAVEEDGVFYSAAVSLRSDLKWTDGSPLTADDVAFTVNTALSFQLGFDWHDFYNPDWLDHAEAVDAHTVKFYFKKQPNVGVWQYGALQGPVVQKAFWEPKVALSVPLLPSAALAPRIEALRSKVDGLQKQVEALTISIASTPMPPRQTQQAQTDLRRKKNSLNEANNDLASAQADFDSAMNAARGLLYALDHKNEPTLGNWMPAGEEDGVWTNEVNPAHPFGEPKFDRAAYVVYPDEISAVHSFQNGEINTVLSQWGLSIASTNMELGPIVSYVNSIAYFLVINPDKAALDDPILRRALYCSIDSNALAKFLTRRPLVSFVAQANDGWFSPQSVSSCGDEPDGSPAQKAINMLRAAGYIWNKEPSGQESGQGLIPPHAAPVPVLQLLSPDQLSDYFAYGAAFRIQEDLQYLGLSVTLQTAKSSEIRYALFSDHEYDMAILGWQVGEYPGYLCDWFGDGNPFGYHSDRLQSACGVLNLTSDLDEARKQIYELQSILAQDLPFIPLYSGVTYDAYRNISYPFDSVPGGLSGIYGAPSLAVPASQ